jgi:hypothetical protein
MLASPCVSSLCHEQLVLRPFNSVATEPYCVSGQRCCRVTQYSAAQFLIEVPYMVFMSVYYVLIVYAMIGESPVSSSTNHLRVHSVFLQCAQPWL